MQNNLYSQRPVSSIKHQASSNRPFIIPVFLPHYGCPHRCIFCNQSNITGVKQPFLAPQRLREWIKEYLTFKGKKRHPVQIAFYGGNFLGLKADEITRLLKEAAGFVKAGSVDSVRFSTRPDTINTERLDVIKPYPVSTIELGVQSMDDQVLTSAKRGHKAQDTEKAVALLKTSKYKIGLQMMVGLPGDNEAKALATGRKIASLNPDFVRIYPTIVLANSPLARWYQDGTYAPWPLERCVTLVKNLYMLFASKNIPVIRMGLQPSDDLEVGSTILAGPFHPAFGHLVYSEIFLDKAVTVLKSKKSNLDTITLKVHPQNISKMRGLKNNNIHILKRKFQIKSLQIVPDAAVFKNSVVVL